MDASGLDESPPVDSSTTDPPPAEVLLPEVVSRSVADSRGLPVRVVPTQAELVGVTHAADLPVVTAELARQVASGIRPPRTFEPTKDRMWRCSATETRTLRYSINVTLDGCCDHRGSCGRRLAPSRGREPQSGRCPSLWPGDVRNDGISVAAAGAGGRET